MVRGRRHARRAAGPGGDALRPVLLIVPAAVLAGSAYILLALFNLPVVLGVAASIVLTGAASLAMRVGDPDHLTKAEALRIVGIGALVLIVVPLLALSHQEQQQSSANARFSAYEQDLVARGLTTQADLDRIHRIDAEILAEHQRLRGCAGRELGCWIEDNEPIVALGLLLALFVAILASRVSKAPANTAG